MFRKFILIYLASLIRIYALDIKIKGSKNCRIMYKLKYLHTGAGVDYNGE